MAFIVGHSFGILVLRWRHAARSNLADHMVKELLPLRDKLGMRKSDIMLVNIAVWVNSEKNLRSNISMWASYYTRHKQQLPFVIWRDASVQHFNTPTGLRDTLTPPLTLFCSPHRDAEAMCCALPTHATSIVQPNVICKQGISCKPPSVM